MRSVLLPRAAVSLLRPAVLVVLAALTLALTPTPTPTPAPSGHAAAQARDASTTLNGPNGASHATLSGQVVMEDGWPGAFVDVFLEQEDGDFSEAVLADDQGRFRFSPVPPGTYRLYAYLAGTVSETHRSLRLVAGAQPFYTIRLTVQEGLLEACRVDARLLDVGSTMRSGVSIGGGTSAQIAYRLAETAVGRPAAGGIDGESYAALEPDDFHDASGNPLSTFAIDVDTASYSNVRRMLSSGAWPPAGAVRVEEMLNAFAYDDLGPTGPEPFGVTSDVVDCPWAPEHRLVRIGLKARDASEIATGPLSLHFLVDVSGSMSAPEKLPLAKQSLRLLVDELDGSDTVSLTVYADAAGVVLPPTPGSDRETILAAIDRLESGGSTNGSGGIRRAYALARDSFVPGGVNRVILATDGDFNVGLSSRSALVELVERERESGVFLTVLGFGTGNLRDDALESLADHGNGQYAYIDSLREAEKVLVRNAAGTLVTVAKDVKVQVEMNPLEVASWRLVGYENRRLAAEDFADDRKDGGELGAGHSVVALYEIAPRGASSKRADSRTLPALRYQQPRATEAAESGELLVVRLRWKEPDGDASRLLDLPVRDEGRSLAAASDDVRFSAAVAAFAEKLRGSERVQDMPWADVRGLADGARGADRFGDRAELVGLVEMASGLEEARTSEGPTDPN